MTLVKTKQIFITSTAAAAKACNEILGVQALVAVEVDWSDLAGCKVVLWPTNTKLQLAAMGRSAAEAFAQGAETVRLIEPGALCADKFDATVALAEGWDRPDMMAWLQAHARTWSPPPVVEAEPVPVGEEKRPGLPEPRAAAPIRTAPKAAYPEHGEPEEKLAYMGIDPEKPPANEDTVMKVLENHPAYVNGVWFDEFLGRIMTSGAGGPREWADADDVALAILMQRTMGLERTKVAHVRGAIISRANSQVRNCAQEWITSHTWDGTERIAHFFPDAFGTPDTPYARAVGQNFWISLVARVMDPGCKVDTMVILEGGQGAGKSSVLKAIGGEWFTVQHESVTGKGFFEVLQGKMLVEIAEMDAFGKAEVTRVKQVVSTETDRYRESYGRYAKDHPRHSIFVGTTNKDDWNRDETGARRFWPIRCVGQVDIDSVLRNRSQLFAEALARWRLGKKVAEGRWWEMPDVETKAEQDARLEDDSWVEPCREWLKGHTQVTGKEVLVGAISMRLADIERPQEMRIAKILRILKWTKTKSNGVMVYRRPDGDTLGFPSE